MVGRIKKSFDAGVEKIGWFSSLLRERIRVEMAVIKLVSEVSELEKKADAFKRTIGQRVFEMKERHVFQKDPDISRALDELEKLEAEIAELKRKASEIEKIED